MRSTVALALALVAIPTLASAETVRFRFKRNETSFVVNATLTCTIGGQPLTQTALVNGYYADEVVRGEITSGAGTNVSVFSDGPCGTYNAGADTFQEGPPTLVASSVAPSLKTARVRIVASQVGRDGCRYQVDADIALKATAKASPTNALTEVINTPELKIVSHFQGKWAPAIPSGSLSLTPLSSLCPDSPARISLTDSPQTPVEVIDANIAHAAAHVVERTRP